MTTVHDAIAFLLARKGGHSSTSSLHKMAYFAQGWHLAWTGEPLFHEEIRTRKGGPFIPAMFPHQKDGATESSWLAGNAAAVTDDHARVLEAVVSQYGDLSGITLGKFANAQAPCMLAVARATDEEPWPVIDLAELMAFFKALDDAPEDRTAYANRFMDQYADEVPDTRSVEHTLIGPSPASAYVEDDHFEGWYWKCSCGAKAASFIGNWPESEDEAREEWRLHRE
ncbi:Panacea domain-containing protein [Paenarthrobacter sp. C1]|uniref:Panacea domain-containing protein n=1 Tax=Paenarthrobacter sp. C1 TaxID=3400220 RepID=UPI003BF5FBE6